MKRSKLWIAAILTILVMAVAMNLTACSEETSPSSEPEQLPTAVNDDNSPVGEKAIESRQKDSMKAMAEIDAEKQKLWKALGEDNIYPVFYAGVRQRMAMGKTKGEAIGQCKTAILEREALCWEAAKHNIKLSDREAAKKLDDYIKEMKSTEDYEKTNAYYKAEGTSLEATMRADKMMYKKMDIVSAFTFAVEEKYKSGALTDEEVLDWDKYWKKTKAGIIKNYEKTEECHKLQRAMQNAAKLFPAGVDKAPDTYSECML